MTTLNSTAQRRIQKIQVEGVSILSLDFRQATAVESLEMLEIYKVAFIGAEPQSMRTLTDVSGLIYDSAVSSKWKVVRMQMDPYIRASAIFGGDGLMGVAIRSYTELMLWLNLPGAKTKLRVFKTREKAVAWLIAH